MGSHPAGEEPGAQQESTRFHQDQETGTEGVMTASLFSPLQFPKLLYMQDYIGISITISHVCDLQ